MIAYKQAAASPAASAGLVLWSTRAAASAEPLCTLALPGVELACSCFGPGPLVFAGTQIGGIVAWDRGMARANGPPLVPLFSTDGLHVRDRAHEAPVCALHLLGDLQDPAGAQLLSVDASGLCITWVGGGTWGVGAAPRLAPASSSLRCFLMPAPTHPTPRQTIHSRREGGAEPRLQLIRSSHFQAQVQVQGKGEGLPSARHPDRWGAVLASAMLLPLSGPTHPGAEGQGTLLLATESGAVLQRSRNHSPCHPRTFGGPRAPLDAATCLSQDGMALGQGPGVAGVPHFLVGYASGRVALFASTLQAPVLVLPVSAHPIQEVHWARHAGLVLFALDARGITHCWDARRRPATAVFQLPRGAGEGQGLGGEGLGYTSLCLPEQVGGGGEAEGAVQVLSLLLALPDGRVEERCLGIPARPPQA
jgi:hypothetical protein